jgi:hypothetical protein
MNPRKKEIASVKPSSSCAESYPCQHSLTIKYKDGTTENGWSNGREIAKKYFNYLSEGQKKHFAKYLGKSGFFGNQSDSDSEQESSVINTQEKKPDNRM